MARNSKQIVNGMSFDLVSIAASGKSAKYRSKFEGFYGFARGEDAGKGAGITVYLDIISVATDKGIAGTVVITDDGIISASDYMPLVSLNTGKKENKVTGAWEEPAEKYNIAMREKCAAILAANGITLVWEKPVEVIKKPAPVAAPEKPGRVTRKRGQEAVAASTPAENPTVSPEMQAIMSMMQGLASTVQGLTAEMATLKKGK